jgi:hypothetical protein
MRWRLAKPFTMKPTRTKSTTLPQHRANSSHRSCPTCKSVDTTSHNCRNHRYASIRPSVDAYDYRAVRAYYSV